MPNRQTERKKKEIKEKKQERPMCLQKRTKSISGGCMCTKEKVSQREECLRRCEKEQVRKIVSLRYKCVTEQWVLLFLKIKWGLVRALHEKKMLLFCIFLIKYINLVQLIMKNNMEKIPQLIKPPHPHIKSVIRNLHSTKVIQS